MSNIIILFCPLSSFQDDFFILYLRLFSIGGHLLIIFLYIKRQTVDAHTKESWSKRSACPALWHCSGNIVSAIFGPAFYLVLAQLSTQCWSSFLFSVGAAFLLDWYPVTSEQNCSCHNISDFVHGPSS